RGHAGPRSRARSRHDPGRSGARQVRVGPDLRAAQPALDPGRERIRLMDAEKVFRLWRRVLRDQEYGDAVLAADREVLAGRDPDERAIALALREHREAAYWPREGYRYRVISAIHAALCAHAPLTERLLAARGVDQRALA